MVVGVFGVVVFDDVLGDVGDPTFTTDQLPKLSVTPLPVVAPAELSPVKV